MNKNLTTLIENNPSIEVEDTKGYYTLKKLWNDSSFQIKMLKTKKMDLLSEIKLPEQLVGIYYHKKLKLEFLYGFKNPKDKELLTAFTFNYLGKNYKCYFDKIGEVVKLLAAGLEKINTESDSNHRNLTDFRNYFKEDYKDIFKSYYEGKQPYSFFIEGDLKSLEKNFSPFLKTINFYLRYYCRENPIVVILNTEPTNQNLKKPCYSNTDNFPTQINGKQINETILDIFSVANTTPDVRLKFIFYFQIIEYCSYYFLEAEVEKKIEKILSNPDVSYNSKIYTKLIQEILQDHINNNKADSVKLDKTITNYISIDDLKSEINENKLFFTKNVEFEGGLKIDKLFDNIDQVNHINNTTLKAVKSNIEKIRNVLVHLRHSKENSVILPTKKNNELILPYLYIVRRIAEKIALQFE